VAGDGHLFSVFGEIQYQPPKQNHQVSRLGVKSGPQKTCDRTLYHNMKQITINRTRNENIRLYENIPTK
jgi:hypothetical protein